MAGRRRGEGKVGRVPEQGIKDKAKCTAQLLDQILINKAPATDQIIVNTFYACLQKFHNPFITLSPRNKVGSLLNLKFLSHLPSPGYLHKKIPPHLERWDE